MPTNLPAIKFGHINLCAIVCPTHRKFELKPRSMVDRKLLTTKLVNEITPPVKGERWIADIKLKGFGLRLWATKAGGQKCYAIRIMDRKQRCVRKTFDPETSGWSTKLRFAYVLRKDSLSYGDYVEEAREWARNEIDRLKGRITLSEENTKRRSVAQKRVKKLTLQKAAVSVIKGMELNGLSQPYIDRIDKLFANNLPKKIQHTPLAKLSADKTADALTNSKLAAGNVRILRSFISQIFERASWYDGRLGGFPEEVSNSFLPKWRKNREVRFPELNSLSNDTYLQIFKFLEEERPEWQQSLCIRVFFEFHAPLKRVACAKWYQIIDNRWYPYDPTEKVYWLESRENITETIKQLLDRISHLVKRDFKQSPFWFPSSTARSFEYIRSVDTIWRKALQSVDLKYYPLREFARSYRDPNTPSYYIDFIRQYGALFREIENVAELSKAPVSRRNSKILSDTYG